MTKKAYELVRNLQQAADRQHLGLPWSVIAEAELELMVYITELEAKAKAWDKHQADQDYMRFTNLRTKSASPETKAHLSGTDAGPCGTKTVDPPNVSP